jgi:hypothetical protein
MNIEGVLQNLPNTSFDQSGQPITSASLPTTPAVPEDIPGREAGKSNFVIGAMCSEFLLSKLQVAEPSLTKMRRLAFFFLSRIFYHTYFRSGFRMRLAEKTVRGDKRRDEYHQKAREGIRPDPLIQ